MRDANLANALREHAEWAEENQWETPITLCDNLAEAADLIEAQAKEIEKLRAQLRHLEELAEANRAGRLVVLPCKVGDTVYILRRTFDGADVVGETELWWDDIPQLGKTVFLTREEAAKALEAMKDGN